MHREGPCTRTGIGKSLDVRCARGRAGDLLGERVCGDAAVVSRAASVVRFPRPTRDGAASNVRTTAFYTCTAFVQFGSPSSMKGSPRSSIETTTGQAASISTQTHVGRVATRHEDHLWRRPMLFQQFDEIRVLRSSRSLRWRARP